jgi:DNA helicase-2/ATP-dependent DNA helicase PcrA
MVTYLIYSAKKYNPQDHIKNMPLLKELNSTQKEAAGFTKGPLLILAGAGSGKTRVLTTRISYLVQEMNVAPDRILAVTFTNKAAGEMRERLAKLLPDGGSKVWLGTFHSLGLRILKRETRFMQDDGTPATAQMTVYDDNDQLRLVKLVMAELNMSEKAIAPRAILSRINQAKNENLTPNEYAVEYEDFFSTKVAAVYTLYQKKLREMRAYDFGDLICEPLRLFKARPEVLKKYSERFLHTLVDEYQDTNKAQYQFIRLLSSTHRNICAVGDPDQSIYGWRGADIGNILDFERDWEDATVMKLEQNYRSTKNILSAANSVIKNNTSRHEKTLWTENDPGELVYIAECRDEHKEAATVIEKLHELMRDKLSTDYESYKDFAIFYRTNAQSRVLEEHFIRDGIPYNILGGVRFYDRMEIKDAISYLRVVMNPHDSLSLKRIINVPPRGIGSVTFDKVSAIAEDEGITLYDAFLEAIKRGILKKPAPAKLFQAIDAMRTGLSEGKFSIHELALKYLEDSGYLPMWEAQATEEAFARIENLHELISAIQDYEKSQAEAFLNREDSEPDENIDENIEEPSLPGFLEQVALINDVDSFDGDVNRITLMTLHSAKGLEFPVVFMVGVEEGLFPHSRSTSDDDELEEERRLCYVGMTRAEKRLFILSAQTRTVFGESRYQTPSRFIDEIDSAFTERIEAPRSQSFIDNDGYDSGAYSSSRSASKSNEPYYTLDESQDNNHASSVIDDYDGFPNDPWQVGMKVRHGSFGIGVVKAREGVGEDVKLTIMFKGAGLKKIIVRYAPIMPA